MPPGSVPARALLPPPTLEARYRHRPEVAFRPLGDETVLLDLSSGTYFDLDATGSRIWQRLAGGEPLACVVEALAAEFDAPRERQAADLLALVAELEREGLVVRAE